MGKSENYWSFYQKRFHFFFHRLDYELSRAYSSVLFFKCFPSFRHYKNCCKFSTFFVLVVKKPCSKFIFIKFKYNNIVFITVFFFTYFFLFQYVHMNSGRIFLYFSSCSPLFTLLTERCFFKQFSNILKF